eukprot:1947626-Rhodomonas_salina.4
MAVPAIPPPAALSRRQNGALLRTAYAMSATTIVLRSSDGFPTPPEVAASYCPSSFPELKARMAVYQAPRAVRLCPGQSTSYAVSRQDLPTISACSVAVCRFLFAIIHLRHLSTLCVLAICLSHQPTPSTHATH